MDGDFVSERKLFSEVIVNISFFQQGLPEQEQILKIMSCSQRGRMEEQRCALSSVKTGPTKNMADG